MGRIRTVLPELITDSKFAALTDAAARLCYGLLAIVDDYGRCSASSSYLAGAIFHTRQRPLSSITKLVHELATAGLIRIYEARGAQYLEISGFQAPLVRSKLARSVLSQRVEKPQPSQIPAPSWAGSENDSPNHSPPYHDPDPRPPTAISESEGRRGNEEAAPGAGGLKPRPGGRAEKLGKDLQALGGDVEESLAAARTFVSEENVVLKSAEAFLVSWFTKAIAKLRKTPAKALIELPPDDVRDFAEWFDPQLAKVRFPDDVSWCAIKDPAEGGLFSFERALPDDPSSPMTASSYFDATELDSWRETKQKVGGHRLWVVK